MHRFVPLDTFDDTDVSWEGKVREITKKQEKFSKSILELKKMNSDQTALLNAFMQQ